MQTRLKRTLRLCVAGGGLRVRVSGAVQGKGDGGGEVDEGLPEKRRRSRTTVAQTVEHSGPAAVV